MWSGNGDPQDGAAVQALSAQQREALAAMQQRHAAVKERQAACGGLVEATHSVSLLDLQAAAAAAATAAADAAPEAAAAAATETVREQRQAGAPGSQGTGRHGGGRSVRPAGRFGGHGRGRGRGYGRGGEGGQLTTNGRGAATAAKPAAGASHPQDGQLQKDQQGAAPGPQQHREQQQAQQTQQRQQRHHPQRPRRDGIAGPDSGRGRQAYGGSGRGSGRSSGRGSGSCSDGGFARGRGHGSS